MTRKGDQNDPNIDRELWSPESNDCRRKMTCNKNEPIFTMKSGSIALGNLCEVSWVFGYSEFDIGC